MRATLLPAAPLLVKCRARDRQGNLIVDQAACGIPDNPAGREPMYIVTVYIE